MLAAYQSLGGPPGGRDARRLTIIVGPAANSPHRTKARAAGFALGLSLPNFSVHIGSRPYPVPHSLPHLEHKFYTANLSLREECDASCSLLETIGKPASWCNSDCEAIPKIRREGVSRERDPQTVHA